MKLSVFAWTIHGRRLLAGVWIALSLSTALPMTAAEGENTVEEFIRQMGSEDRDERRTASYRLSQMGVAAQPAVPVLIQALEDRDDQVWFNAVTALARIGPDASEAVPALIQQLEQSDRGRYRTRSQYRIAFALGSMGKEAVPALGKALSHERSYVRESAARALTWIGPSGDSLIPNLIQCLGDAEEEVRLTAAEALGSMGTLAGDPILHVLRDEKASVDQKAAAAAALGWMLEPKPQLVQSLADLYDQGMEAAVRAAVIKTLDKWRYDHRPFLKILVDGLRSEDEAVRQASEDSLILMHPAAQTSVPALVALLREDDASLQQRAVRILGEIGTSASAAIAPLEKMSQDPSLPEETRQLSRKSLEAIQHQP